MRIVVSDMGSGIASEKLSRLFTPFDRLGAEQSAVEGTGLGLALSARIIHAMGAVLVPAAQLDAAALFGSIFLEPNRLQPQSRNTVRMNPHWTRTSLPASAPSFISRTIFPISISFRKFFASNRRSRLLSAMQGRLGLDLARKHSPDLILLDIHLPDLNGWDVFSQLRGEVTTRDIPVIIISADATARQIQQFMTAGARDYLTKPFDVTKFSRVIEESAWPSTDSKTLIQKPNKSLGERDQMTDVNVPEKRTIKQQRRLTHTKWTLPNWQSELAANVKMKILIVDDEPANVALLEDMLGEQGYTHLKSTTDSRRVFELCRRVRSGLDSARFVHATS